jgi:hypothetical protein
VRGTLKRTERELRSLAVLIYIYIVVEYIGVILGMTEEKDARTMLGQIKWVETCVKKHLI